jgi:hypothetical protein
VSSALAIDRANAHEAALALANAVVSDIFRVVDPKGFFADKRDSALIETHFVRLSSAFKESGKASLPEGCAIADEAQIEGAKAGAERSARQTDNIAMPKAPAGNVACARRAKPVPDDEAEILVREFIAAEEKAVRKVTVRRISERCGIAVGRISKMAPWRAYMTRRKKGTPTLPRQARQLTDAIIAAIGKDDDPGAKLMSKEEAAWEWLEAKAKDTTERAKLASMTREERAEAIKAVIEQLADEKDAHGDIETP